MPFNFWFVHTPPGGHIDGISGDCDLNKQKKVKWPTCPYGQGQGAPLSPTASATKCHLATGLYAMAQSGRGSSGVSRGALNWPE